MGVEILPVKVVHGSDSNTYNLGGKTVAEARELLDDEVFNGSLAGLVALLNGQRLEDAVDGEDTVLQSDDVLTFLSRGGDKG